MFWRKAQTVLEDVGSYPGEALVLRKRVLLAMAATAFCLLWLPGTGISAFTGNPVSPASLLQTLEAEAQGAYVRTASLVNDLIVLYRISHLKALEPVAAPPAASAVKQDDRVIYCSQGQPAGVSPQPAPKKART